MLFQTLSSTLLSISCFDFFLHPSPSCTSNHTTPLYLPLPQAIETEMECVEAALKSNYRKEMTLKLSPQTLTEEVSVQNGTACDDFFVNDLLNLSHVEEEPEQGEEDTACVSLKQENPSHESCTFKDDYASVPTSELSVPADDVANLEWLSHFVEDSFSEECSAPIPTVMENPTTGFKEAEPEPEILVFTFKTPVHTKARSKRTRNGVPVWSFGSPSFTDSFSSSTTSSSSSSSPSPSSPLLIYTNNFPQSLDRVCSGPKPKKPSSSDNTTLAPPPRRCSHCGLQKTPQWRNGPLGPKTLCNACGVRFKSGRLLPEYRPACSPTFSNELHSNHHRKVLEMRRKKEIVSVDETGFAPAHVVPSF